MKFWLKPCAALSLALAALPAHAGVYTDDLAKCLVSSTSDADKAQLMRWVFSAIALNKQVAPYVDMPADMRAEIDQQAAALYMRLLTESCRTQTHDAFKYEGQAAVGAAFQVLGQVASQGIFSDPAVIEGMTGMVKLLDQGKLQAVIDDK